MLNKQKCSNALLRGRLRSSRSVSFANSSLRKISHVYATIINAFICHSYVTLLMVYYCTTRLHINFQFILRYVFYGKIYVGESRAFPIFPLNQYIASQTAISLTSHGHSIVSPCRISYARSKDSLGLTLLDSRIAFVLNSKYPILRRRKLTFDWILRSDCFLLNASHIDKQVHKDLLLARCQEV